MSQELHPSTKQRQKVREKHFRELLLIVALLAPDSLAMKETGNELAEAPLISRGPQKARSAIFQRKISHRRGGLMEIPGTDVLTRAIFNTYRMALCSPGANPGREMWNAKEVLTCDKGMELIYARRAEKFFILDCVAGAKQGKCVIEKIKVSH